MYKVQLVAVTPLGGSSKKRTLIDHVQEFETYSEAFAYGKLCKNGKDQGKGFNEGAYKRKIGVGFNPMTNSFDGGYITERCDFIIYQ